MSTEEVLEITNRMEKIDGEDVYILTRGMEESIEKLRVKTKIEKEDAMFSMLDRDLEFIDNHAGFAIAFRPVKWKNVKKWIPCMLYKYGGEWRRVVLQYADCSACGWHGNRASPTEPDLYITLENRFEILKRMGQLSFRSCPVCGSRISTKAIWIEEG